MAERSQFSASGQEVYKGTFFENFILRRISRRVLLFPEKFDETGKAGALHVNGTRTETETSIKLAEQIRGDGERAVSFTDITVGYPVGAAAIHSLSAERYVTDEVGDLMGVEPSRQRFVLGVEDNDISIYDVMRTITRAQHTVEWAQALRELATADDPTLHGKNFMQTF
ncbi:MAG TPA: hypothetical protein VHA05_01205 [Candidatus Saccharimonadales bacterium]|jgi:hypothetical protein|nr:hypothetical protein [Candidatus Saccharimonadales bacterium]